MNKDEIKSHLFENPNLIVELLEEMNCGQVKHVRGRYVIASLPDGDNGSSINIKLSPSLYSRIYTRSDFEAKFEYRDIYSLVQYIKEIDLPSAIRFVATTLNLKYDSNAKQKERSASADFLKSFKRKKKALEQPKEVPLTYKTSDRFVTGYDTIFVDDGVSSEAHDLFEVSYDIFDNRVVFPIKNEAGDILTFKGRTMQADYKTRGIPKFIYYYNFDARFYLFGLYENYNYIINSDEIIVCEPEKGVMQFYTMGIRNVVASSKKKISEEQVRKLLQLGKPVVIAFDKDVEEIEIIGECRRFKGLIDVYYILDKEGLLSGKDSPSDHGFIVWNELYKNKIKYEER